jgi:hypothetical protein
MTYRNYIPISSCLFLLLAGCTIESLGYLDSGSGTDFASDIAQTDGPTTDAQATDGGWASDVEPIESDTLPDQLLISDSIPADSSPPDSTVDTQLLDSASPLPAECLLIPEKGPCKALFKRYYFDQGTRTCESFTWGGCQGVVPFATLVDCESACL